MANGTPGLGGKEFSGFFYGQIIFDYDLFPQIGMILMTASGFLVTAVAVVQLVHGVWRGFSTASSTNHAKVSIGGGKTDLAAIVGRPATAVTIVAWLAIPALLVGFFVLPAGAWMAMIVAVVSIPIALIAASRMRSFQSRGLAIAGSVLIMMPFTVIALAGIPVGIWSGLLESLCHCSFWPWRTLLLGSK